MITLEDLKVRNSEISKKVQDAVISINKNLDDVKVIAVSKTHPVEYIIEAIKAGINIFGENYAQEMKDKYIELSKLDITQPEWHFIGHLQINKVKYLAEFVNFIHSVDSIKLAMEISKQAKKFNRTIQILVQVNTSGELSKSGLEPEEVQSVVEEIIKIESINLVGLMTIGSFTDDENQQRKEFGILRNTLENLNQQLNLNLNQLSMGMSNDYYTAISEGSTMVRIGTAFFGSREYIESK